MNAVNELFNSSLKKITVSVEFPVVLEVRNDRFSVVEQFAPYVRKDFLVRIFNEIYKST
jgi:hypothetical protein